MNNPKPHGVQRMLVRAVIGLLASTLVALAHHSLNAEFDRTRETQYRATVTSFEWGNPHATFHAKVQLDGGTTTVWIFELPAPSGLHRYGWTPETLRANDSIVVSAFPARDGSAKASAHSVVLGNGQTLEVDHPFAKAPER